MGKPTTYPTVPRRWPGATIACVASGPSLTAEDASYLRGRVRVIAVNDGIRFTHDFADVLYSSDYRWWQHYKGCPNFTGQKFAIERGRGAGQSFYEHLPTVNVLRLAGRDGLERSPDGLRDNHNSGAAAINLAVHLGATRILLLGYNCGPLNGRQHFYNNSDRPWQLPVTDQKNYKAFQRYFASMVEPLKEVGVTVVNCTPHTHLTCFPSAVLREALAADARAAEDALTEAVA